MFVILVAIVLFALLLHKHIPFLTFVTWPPFIRENTRMVWLLVCTLFFFLLLESGGLAFVPALAVAIAMTFFTAEKMAKMPLTSQFFSAPGSYEEPPLLSRNGGMSKEEARAILNISKEATKNEIKQAYHGLIRKNHPDHGGSSYLAAKINQARDILL